MNRRQHRVRCPDCPRLVAVSPDGTLRAHPPGGPHCPGSWQDPPPVPDDGDYPLAARAAAALGLTDAETAEALRVTPDRAHALLAAARVPRQKQEA